jgi:hypothetical protein
VTRDIQGPSVTGERVEELMADAGEFFEAHLWEVESSENAREALAKRGLNEDVIRAFGVGYAPVGPDVLINHLAELGYSVEELEAGGLVTLSVRGRPHAQFRSRLMFPVRDREGRILGFAGLGTHVGPSWALWITSPDTVLYRRSEAVFGLDRAASMIAASRTATVGMDCIEVMRAHQDGETNAITVHSSGITYEQLLTLAADISGGIDGLRLDAPEGMRVDWDPEDQAARLPESRDGAAARSAPAAAAGTGRGLNLKRIAIVVATGLAAVNLWTGAPLLAIWVGSQAQGGQVLSLRGVLTVLVVLSASAFLLGWVLAWLSAKYDQLIGRPPTLARTSPWQRRMRGELDEHLRTRYALSAPERVLAACVIAGVLAFEVWFFFFAGSSIG